MDNEGYATLENICKFNRLVTMGGTPQVLLDAVRCSQNLDYIEPAEVTAARDTAGGQLTVCASTLLSTRIRAKGYLSWAQ